MTDVVIRTWRVTEYLAKVINEKAEELGVYPSDLVRFFLTVGIEQLDAGTLEIPTCSAGPPLKVDWSRVKVEQG